jgi:hypothetical protein
MALWRSKKADVLPAGESLQVKDLIRMVTDELMQSRQEREDRHEPAIFEVEKLTLEVHFVAQTSTEFNGGLDLKVVTVGGGHVGGKRTYQNQQVHTITLTLAGAPYETSQGDDALAGLDTAPRFRPSGDD